MAINYSYGLNPNMGNFGGGRMKCIVCNKNESQLTYIGRALCNKCYDKGRYGSMKLQRKRMNERGMNYG